MSFNARDFLQSLYADAADAPMAQGGDTQTVTAEHVAGVFAVELTPDDLPWDWRIEWEERAAIREYDGGQAREHAEAEALREVVEMMHRKKQDSA